MTYLDITMGKGGRHVESDGAPLVRHPERPPQVDTIIGVHFISGSLEQPVVLLAEVLWVRLLMQVAGHSNRYSSCLRSTVIESAADRFALRVSRLT